MKVIAKITFRDKDNFDKVYLEGEEYDFSPERVAELKELDLVEVIEVNEEEQRKKDLLNLELIPKNYKKMESLVKYFKLEVTDNKAESFIEVLTQFKNSLNNK
ncbi:hypothetical protein CAPN008_01360 [Capnocytophaga canis]|uniref:hypothetical protein n=1 Tax=Capnocytophaga canis TaxID=1848903 RepID=UPI001AC98D97|nr:hypothetical protein [Capnocytophaga canis]GIM60086.1 hypothetical protein CAPN008_01360 [Capnocytophaga canis]